MASADVYSTACARFGIPNRRMSTRAVLRFGSKGSIAVQLSGEKSGAWYDHEAHTGGWLDGCGDQPYTRRQRLDQQLRENAPSDSRRWFYDVCSSMVPLEPGCDGWRYLNARGIISWPEDVLAWLPHSRHLVVLARDGDYTVRALQLIAVRPDGFKRREEASKRTLTEYRGWHHTCAVRLPGRSTTVFCEGPENALSVWQAHAGKRTVLCHLGASGIAEYRGARGGIIGCDGDDPGSPAWEYIRKAAKIRMRRTRSRVFLAVPPLGRDWNDILRADGEEAVRDGFKKESLLNV